MGIWIGFSPLPGTRISLNRLRRISRAIGSRFTYQNRRLRKIFAQPIQYEEWVIYPQGVKPVPLYAYRCTECGHRFEKIQNFSAKPEQECPKCKGLLERPLTAPGLHFKGSGFYINDYSSGAPSATEASAPASKATESQPPCATGGSCAACPAAAPATTSSAS